ncbi:hypothetical protein BD779DRAFT_1792430 [Infundibulicybe gibba]|nr:hypothetical protein BD779DRAFT_1792430 [Infundibulicybe gibba]
MNFTKTKIFEINDNVNPQLSRAKGNLSPGGAYVGDSSDTASCSPRRKHPGGINPLQITFNTSNRRTTAGSQETNVNGLIPLPVTWDATNRSSSKETSSSMLFPRGKAMDATNGTSVPEVNPRRTAPVSASSKLARRSLLAEKDSVCQAGGMTLAMVVTTGSYATGPLDRTCDVEGSEEVCAVIRE